MRAPSQRRRGMSLLEALVAVAVLGIGVASIFGLLGHVAHGQRTLSFSAQGTDRFATLAAEIRDARCDYQATNPPSAFSIDPGLALVPPNTWVDDLAPPPAGSSIRAYGVAQDTTPRLRISYRVRPVGAFTGARAAALIPSYEVDVRVRQLMNDPLRDDPLLEEGHWIRVFTVEKLCNGRIDQPTATQSGRGEFAP